MDPRRSIRRGSLSIPHWTTPGRWPTICHICLQIFSNQGKTEYFVKNTADFSKDLKGIKMKEGEIMNSHVAVALFTNVPHPTGAKSDPSEFETGLLPPQAPNQRYGEGTLMILW